MGIGVDEGLQRWDVDALAPTRRVGTRQDRADQWLQRPVHTGTFIESGTMVNGPGVNEIGLLRVEAQVPDWDPVSQGGPPGRVTQM
jgi:hypothetical protein